MQLPGRAIHLEGKRISETLNVQFTGDIIDFQRAGQMARELLFRFIAIMSVWACAALVKAERTQIELPLLWLYLTADAEI